MLRPVYLYLDIMTSYILSPFLLTRVQTAVRGYRFLCPFACCLHFFFAHLDIMTSYTLSPFLLTGVQTAGARL